MWIASLSYGVTLYILAWWNSGGVPKKERGTAQSPFAQVCEFLYVKLYNCVYVRYVMFQILS